LKFSLFQKWKTAKIWGRLNIVPVAVTEFIVH
jgi:hypothetical protein